MYQTFYSDGKNILHLYASNLWGAMGVRKVSRLPDGIRLIVFQKDCIFRRVPIFLNVVGLAPFVLFAFTQYLCWKYAAADDLVAKIMIRFCFVNFIYLKFPNPGSFLVGGFAPHQIYFYFLWKLFFFKNVQTFL